VIVPTITDLSYMTLKTKVPGQAMARKWTITAKKQTKKQTRPIVASLQWQ
jgi:hypothetical protein